MNRSATPSRYVYKAGEFFNEQHGPGGTCVHVREKEKDSRPLLHGVRRAPVMALPVILLHPYFRSRLLPTSWSQPGFTYTGRAAQTILFGISAV